MKAVRTYIPPTLDEQNYVQHILERQFRNVVTKIPSGWDSRQNFDRTLMQLDKKSSPGWPLCREKPTIGEWLFGPGLFPIKTQSDKLWSMVNSVFEGDYTHIYKVFAKAEPHSFKKIEEKRWRLIMMSSLPVQVAWHMLLGHLAERLLPPYKTPLAHGLVYFGGGWKLFRHYIKQHRMNWTADKSGWDWNSPWWVYEVTKCLLVALSDTEDIDPAVLAKWLRVLNILFKDAFSDKKVILPDSTILQQLIGGLMPSGCVWTIQINGIAQLALHILALKRMRYPRITRLLATGDDTIQEMPPDLDAREYVKHLQQAGCVVKESGEGSDFMGFEILWSGFYPKYFEKHLENLKIQKPEFLQETIEGYLRIYCYDEELYSFWRRIAQRLDFPMPSRTYFLYFAEHPDALEEFTFARPSFGDRQVSKDVVV